MTREDQLACLEELGELRMKIETIVKLYNKYSRKREKYTWLCEMVGRDIDSTRERIKELEVSQKEQAFQK